MYIISLFFKLLKEVRKKKIFNAQKSENQYIETKYTEDELITLNINIANFFEFFSKIFENFDYSSISKDLISLKIIYFYFSIYEYTRDFDSISDILKKL